MNEKLQASLDLVTNGWPIFPCVPGEKRPLVRGGFHAATLSEETINTWGRKWPEANVATPTGKGLLVVDIDPRNGGKESLRRLVKEHDSFPQTLRQKTPAGWHLFFHYPEEMDIRSRPLPAYPGVDIKAAGGYVLLPPSRNGTGVSYRWENDAPIADAPDWLLALVTERPKPEQTTGDGQRIGGGLRNDTLTRIAGAIRRQGCTEEEIIKSLLAVNLRCVPPLDTNEVLAIGRSVANYPPAANNGAKVEGPVGVLISDVKREKVNWLARNRIPLGKVTIIDGDPDLGKSTLCLEIAARTSVGEAVFPGDTEGVLGGAVILTAEDGLGDTVRPRLEAAGADISRIVALRYTPETEGEKTVSNIPVDIPIIMEAIERVDARLIIVDVLVAYLPSQTNTYRDQDIRLALAPLAEMAARCGVAVICIRHLRKSSGTPLYRGGGSIGIIGAARAGFLVERDPEDRELIIFAQTKSNLGPPMPSLCYRLEDGDGAVHIAWQGESHYTAATLLAAAVVDGDAEHGALADAKAFLREELNDGPAKPEEIMQAAKLTGITISTLRRAKNALGVYSQKEGGRKAGYWVWKLPPEQPEEFEDAHPGDLEDQT